MKKYLVEACQSIIDPYTMRIHTKEGLIALDGYWTDIIEVEAPNDGEEVFDAFYRIRPDVRRVGNIHILRQIN